MDDWELLQEYAQRGSETSFRELVNRHLGLVYSAALRQVNDPALAQEICQAVFTLLARKAGTLRQGTVLTGWLFTTTRFVASRTLRGELRRRRREQEALVMQQANVSEGSWQRIAPELDEALEKLGQVERNAVLLRFFEDKNHRQVGAALGISEEAAKKRVNRGLERLRAFFAGRGFTISAAMLGSLMLAHAIKLPPAGLLETVVSATKIGSTATSQALVNRAVNQMLRVKLKWVAVSSVALLLSVALVTVGSRMFWPGSSSSPAARDLNSIRRVSSAKSATSKANFPAKFRLRVVDAEDGRALSDARLIVAYFHGDSMSVNLSAGPDGVCEVSLLPDFFTLRVWVSAARHVPKVIDWHDYERPALPEEYLLKLDRGRIVSGVVRDESGQPIVGAKVQIHYPGFNMALRENVGYYPMFNYTASDPAFSYATTDDKGQWTFDVAPKDGAAFEFFAIHDDFAKLREVVHLTGLWTSNVVFVLKPGVSLAGSVVTESGTPIADASVTGEDQLSTRTDLQGQFVFPHVSERPIKLWVDARGYTGTSRTVEPTANPEDKRFVLKEENQPGGSTANATGQGAPRRLHLVGRVVDAETGRAVDRFNVLMDENRGTQLKFVGEGRDGRFDWQYPVQFFNQFGLEIEAEGYAPEASALASIKDPEQTYEFKLKKSSDIRGQVVSSDGQPIAGADVFLGGRGMGPSMAHSPVRGYFLVSNEREHEGHTDLHGNFRFKRTYRADRVVVSHDSGYAAVSLSALSNGPIALEPWSRVEGTLRIGRGPGAKQTVGMRVPDSGRGKLQFPFSMNAKTDDAGRFVFEHVPQGTMELFRVFDSHEGLPGVIGLSHLTKIQVAAAVTNEVTFGGFGRQVIGQIRTSLTNTVVDWKRDLQRLVDVRTEDSYYLAVGQDGSFLADDVPPGKYRLELRLTQPPADPLSDERFMPSGRELGSLKRDVTIPEAASDQTDSPVDLGQVVLQLKAPPEARRK